MAELTKEQRDILIKTAEYMVKRENTSEYSENIRKVAEIGLAALTAGMEQEPVAFIARYESGAIHGTCDRDDPVKIEWLKRGMDVSPLYAAPQLPQPAVPECYQRLLHHAYGMTMGHDWNKGTMAGHHREKLYKAVEDCRAAMLGAEPVSQPYTLPHEVRDAINRLLDSDGSRGTFSAVRSSDAREELERLLVAAPQQEAFIAPIEEVSREEFNRRYSSEESDDS